MLVCLSVASTGCPGGGASAADMAGMYASLRALESALNGVHSVVQQADDVTKDRLADADSRMQRTVKTIDDLLTRHEKKGEQVAVEVLNKAFDEGNEALFTASLAVQDAAVDFDQVVAKAIVGAANVVAGVPFTKVRPFALGVFPTALLPGTKSDYDIKIVGYFPDQLGKPRFVFPTGEEVEASVGVDSRLHLAVPVSMVNSYKGKRLKVGLKYKVQDNMIFPDDFVQRDIWLDVLPSKVIDYSINAQALPDTVHDRPVVYRDAGTPAGAGEARHRDIPWGFDDLTPDVDFNALYDKSGSSIESAIIVAAGGNNPTGDNSCNLTESSGGRVVLHEYAHGKPSTLFEGGKGADVYCKVAITLRLARRSKPIQWHFKGGAKESGEVSWGGNVELFPEGDKELSDALLNIIDHTFDPPQHRTLALKQSYRSKYVHVNNTPQRISIVARSTPFLQ